MTKDTQNFNTKCG